MPNFLKQWEKATHKAVEGDDNIFYFSCKSDKMLCSVGKREIKSCILLFLFKCKDETLLAGCINGEFIFYNKDGKVVDDEFEVKAIFDDRKRRLLLLFNKQQFICSEDETAEEQTQILVFEVNAHYQDMVFYDSKVSTEPAFMMDESNNLRIIAYSLISEVHNHGKDLLQELIK